MRFRDVVRRNGVAHSKQRKPYSREGVRYQGGFRSAAVGWLTGRVDRLAQMQNANRDQEQEQ